MSAVHPSTQSPSTAAAHQPFVPADQSPPELTLQAVLVGAILGIVFGASSLYLVLKAGMTVSASIPIAVLSITLFRGFSRMLGARSATILENNIVQTTGSAGESIAFGVGVTMPALMVLGYDLELTRVMLVACLGGLLGILMMIPLRRAFIVKQHGRLAYPEGTACADVLIVGEKGGTSAATVFTGFGIGFIYWFCTDALKLFLGYPARALGFFKGAVLTSEVSPHLLGVGYIIGTRVSCIMVAGGVLAAWVFTPAIVFFGEGLTAPLYPGQKLISQMSPGDIRSSYVLYIGAGAVATGGIISMIQAMPLILASIVSGLGDIAQRAGGNGGGAAQRTDRDLPLSVVLFGSLGIVAAVWAAPMLHMNLIGAVLIVLFGFLFVTVSSRLTGEIGSSSNPISGMTVATLLMTCLIFLWLGWESDFHKLTALSIAGIVCIAASNGGTTSQDLKTGYLVGGTPKSQQISILVGALTSALVIGGTLLVLNEGGTVYSKKELPTAAIPLKGTEKLEHVRGPLAASDTKEYHAVHVRTGQVAGVQAGKYLVDDAGQAQYLVDPAVNGRLTAHDDGTPATKYDAPKAVLMAFIIDGILSRNMPWELVLLGAAIALVLELAGVPSLPFAVGVYLPLTTSMPIFIGGMVRWVADRLARRSAAESEMSPGVLLSSGLIAGGTIAGVVAALIGLQWNMAIGEQVLGPWATSNAFALALFALMVLFLLIVGAKRERPAAA